MITQAITISQDVISTRKSIWQISNYDPTHLVCRVFVLNRFQSSNFGQFWNSPIKVHPFHLYVDESQNLFNSLTSKHRRNAHRTLNMSG